MRLTWASNQLEILELSILKHTNLSPSSNSIIKQKAMLEMLWFNDILNYFSQNWMQKIKVQWQTVVLLFLSIYSTSLFPKNILLWSDTSQIRFSLSRILLDFFKMLIALFSMSVFSLLAFRISSNGHIFPENSLETYNLIK